MVKPCMGNPCVCVWRVFRHCKGVIERFVG